MNKHSILQQYISIHSQKLNEKGFTAEALWGSKDSQQKRFTILSNLFLSKSNLSILDIGCGLGDLYLYLKENNFTDIDYTGIDIMPEFIEASSHKFPDQNFILGSIDKLPKNKNYDYVVASGIYNLGKNAEESSTFFVEQLKEIYDRITIGFAVNFLSIHSKNPDSISTYHDPSAILTICLKNFSSHIVLNHNYLPNDFTIFVYKQ